MARLILEDGREFYGKSIGKHSLSFGELVFNTAMTGYQETISDPSYAGQIITFTYPEIGNYGCNKEDLESNEIFTKGIVIKNYSPIASNFRSEQSLNDFLEENNITGICGVDTRAITKHIRDKGAMRALISHDETQSSEELVQLLQSQTSMSGSNLAKEVSCKEEYDFNTDGSFFVVAIDFGIKKNILNKLKEHGARVRVLPANTDIKRILELNPDGVFLSNGPGDPAAVDYAIKTVQELVTKFHKPIFGICLGHQILALAMGAQTYKLKFGHRGSNQPIKNLQNSKIEIASHNHGFAVSPENLPESLIVTHLNINDNTIAGIKLKNRPNVFSVQYHPEASPGPHDSDYLFQNFSKLILQC